MIYSKRLKWSSANLRQFFFKINSLFRFQIKYVNIEWNDKISSFIYVV